MNFLLASEINPFIRRAFILKKIPYNKLVKNADCRIFYILDGEGEIEIENKTYTVEKDCLGIWKSGTEYTWKIKKDSSAQIAIINFDYTLEFSNRTQLLTLIPKNMFSSCKIYDSGDFEDITVLNKPIFLKNMNIFKKDVLEIINELEELKLYSLETANTILHHLILKIARYVTISSSSEKLKIEPVLDYIQANFDKEITNISLGKMINYHPHYINSLMKELIGTTLHSYLTEYRMNEALKLLLNTDYSIEIIAQKVGYKNPTHFCNVFRKKFGISPAKHRKSAKMV